MTDDVELVVPRAGAGEDTVTVYRWLLPDGARVEPGTEVVDVGTTKATLAIEAPAAGYLCIERGEGERVAVGDRLGRVTWRALDEGEARPVAPAPRPSAPLPVISDAARALMQTHGVDVDVFAGRTTVRTADVEAWLGIRDLRARLHDLRRSLDEQHRRHVPVGTLLHDRWQLAAERGFGEGTSVYDECLILGDVEVGTDCWIGPFTVLDGSRGALRIGDHTQIGTGAHVYTHNSIAQCLTGGQAAPFGAPTTIGRCCFISPQAIVAAGTVLGDHCFVASGSFVEGLFPSYSYIAGAPAVRVGRVEIEGDRVRMVREAP